MNARPDRLGAGSIAHQSGAALLAGAFVFAASYLSLHFTGATGRVSALWPVNAVLLVWVLRSPRRSWPLILAGGLAGNVATNLLSADTVAQALALAGCNTLEVSICAYGLARFASPALDLSQRRDFTAFALICALAAPLLAGAIAGLYLASNGVAVLAPATATWILADALGLFILTPALLLVTDPVQRAAAIRSLKTGSPTPLVALGVLIVASLFGPWHSAFILAPPVLVLVTIHYQMAGAAAAMLSVTLLGVGLALAGSPALFWGTPAEQLLKLQGFLAVVAATILPLGVVVSQRMALSQDLADARDRAEGAAAAKSEFLANMSHELRTPLTSIIGFAGLLRDDEEINPRQARYVRRVTDASQALMAVINDVLDFSKLEAGELALDPRPTCPRELIRETVGLVSLQAAAKDLKLVLQHDNLPPSVMIDEGRLRQVLLNLLSNAVKFTTDGQVTVASFYRHGRLRVSVADTGPGVPADRLERLFQRFSQADGSISRRYGGTGLGLAICRSLVELMDGSIGVRTEPGEGSTFTFEVAAPEAEARAEAANQAGLEAAPAGVRVLLVDDAPANRELVRTILEPLGLTVTEAEDGAAALAEAASQPFDLILMDVRMPGIDGIAATRGIRAGRGPNRATPILGLSADVQICDIAACRQAGMNDHVAKPIVVPDLVSKVLNCIRPEPAEGAA